MGMISWGRVNSRSSLAPRGKHLFTGNRIPPPLISLAARIASFIPVPTTPYLTLMNDASMRTYIRLGLSVFDLRTFSFGSLFRDGFATLWTELVTKEKPPGLTTLGTLHIPGGATLGAEVRLSRRGFLAFRTFERSHECSPP